MIIRNQSIEAFRPSAQRSFEERMVEHLNKHFPDHCKALGDEGVRKAIKYGTDQAATYQIVTERDACKYLTLMFAFGHKFDRDPNLPWVSGILRNRVYMNGTDRIEALYRTAKRHSHEASRQPEL